MLAIRFSTRCVLLLFVTLLLGFGCAKKGLYQWQGYSSSLYTYKKNLDDKSYAGHKKVLEKIIEECGKHDNRVPPGIYCEYGYMLAKEGKSKEALTYFDQEEKTYPESAVMINALKNMVTAKDKTKEIPSDVDPKVSPERAENDQSEDIGAEEAQADTSVEIQEHRSVK